MTPETAATVELLQKLGVPAFVILLAIIAPILMPLVLKMMKSKIEQTQTMTATLPRIETHLHDMAKSGSASQNSLQQIIAGQKRQETKLDQLLQRRP